jgi:hypothetical protein
MYVLGFSISNDPLELKYKNINKTIVKSHHY